MRFNVHKLFLKALYVFILFDSSGIEINILDAVYLHDLKPVVVDFNFGRSTIVVPLRV